MTPNDQQDFGWLDEPLETLQSEAWRCGTNDESMHETDYWFEQAKAAIQTHLTTQAKQHQADLLRARINELSRLKDSKVMDIAGKFVLTYANNRQEELQAELDKLEGKK